MRRIAILIAVAAVISLFAWSIPASSQTPERIRIEVYEGGGFTKYLDGGRSGFSSGDTALEHRRVHDSETGEVLGKTVTRLTIVKGPAGNPLFYIDCEVEVGGGSITFAGGARFGDLPAGATFAVTGGTGAYQDATGTVTISGPVERDGLESFDFAFDLAP